MSKALALCAETTISNTFNNTEPTQEAHMNFTQIYDSMDHNYVQKMARQAQHKYNIDYDDALQEAYIHAMVYYNPKHKPETTAHWGIKRAVRDQVTFRHRTLQYAQALSNNPSINYIGHLHALPGQHRDHASRLENQESLIKILLRAHIKPKHLDILIRRYCYNESMPTLAKTFNCTKQRIFTLLKETLAQCQKHAIDLKLIEPNLNRRTKCPQNHSKNQTK